MIDGEKCYVVGQSFKGTDTVRIKGVRGTGKIIGSKFRAVVIEYFEYTVVIGNHAHKVRPDQLQKVDPPKNDGKE